MMPLAMIITPIPMGTRVQSDYIKGWMVAVFMCKQNGIRWTPANVQQECLCGQMS